MSSVGRTTSSSGVSSLYGTRNVLSGLASGLDTEAMIENAISGYKTKIATLNQKRTKIEWQQESYRSIVTKMNAFTGKYADYMGTTNLMSAGFFNQSVTVASQGDNAAKVSASGKTSSDIRINGVRQLATAATYRIGGGNVGNSSGVTEVDGKMQATAGGSFGLNAMEAVSTVSGTLSIAYGGSSARSYLDVSLDELDTFSSAEEMADAINKQLWEQSVTTSSGATVKLDSSMIRARANADGDIVFESPNSAYIASATGDIAQYAAKGTGGKEGTISLSGVALTEDVKTSEYLSNATMKITLDGVTKTIEMPGKDVLTDGMTAEERNQAYIDALQQNIDDAFGTLEDGGHKLEVANAASGGSIQLQFTAGQPGSSFSVTSAKAEAMGLTDSGLNSALDANKKLSDLLGVDENGYLKGLEHIGEGDDAVYSFKLNGVEIGKFKKDTDLSTIMSKINANTEAGVSATYSKTTNEFVFTAKESGMAGEIDFGSGFDKLFGGAGGEFKAGQDAIFSATINGKEMELTRSSNTVDLDGMSVNFKGTFGYQRDENGDLVQEAGKYKLDANAEAVTFKSTTDADKIVDAIKSMVNDYNEMVTEIKNAYSTLPLQRSNGKYYEPLTDDDMADMSETAVKNWNEKAKTGLLFGDSDLSSLYYRLTDAVSMTGQDGADLKAAGITVKYANGLTTLDFDENQLRATLETDPDRVKDIFTKSQDTGSSTNGFMQALKEPLDLYGKTTGINLSTGTKGLLVNKAGHPLASSTMYNNTIQQQLDALDEEISSWQDKMSDKVDYYTNKFTRLETLINQMNSQTSALSGLMGG